MYLERTKPTALPCQHMTVNAADNRTQFTVSGHAKEVLTLRVDKTGRRIILLRSVGPN